MTLTLRHRLYLLCNSFVVESRSVYLKVGMKYYSVQQLATLAGVSVRTLHVYDEAGLLKPATRTEAKYRMYGEKELLRLQQILFYKELDFPLQEIRAILDDPEFDLIEALKHHKSALQTRQERLTTLLTTIDKTISHLQEGEFQMTPEELYEGLPKETAEAYRKEATAKWGDAVKRSEEALRKLSKADFGKLKDEMKANWQTLASMMHHDPTSDAVQEHIAHHYVIIRKFWGTDSLADKQAKQYAGLGQMYIDDPRYTELDGKPNPEFAVFLSKAMSYFAETALTS